MLDIKIKNIVINLLVTSICFCYNKCAYVLERLKGSMEVQDYLKKLKNKGYTSYIVGGYTRDYLLGLNSFDVDITTAATPNDVRKVFNINGKDNFGSIRIKDEPYIIDITTFRKEISYSGRKPKVVFIEEVLEDLFRRDFTINAICLDDNLEVYDPLGGFEDLKSKTIRVIGDIAKKFQEDPLRILRAIRFAVIYDFEIEENAYRFIKENGRLLKSLSYKRKIEELDLMFNSPFYQKALDLLEDLNLLDALGLKLEKDYFVPKTRIGIWIYVNPVEAYPFSKLDKKRMSDIRAILALGDIDRKTIFTYGIKNALIAGNLLGIKEDKIVSIYDSLPIKSESELVIDGDTIKSVLNLNSSLKIGKIKSDVLYEVLKGTLKNERSILIKYLLENWK